VGKVGHRSCGRQLRQSSLQGYGLIDPGTDRQTGSQHIIGNHNIYVRLTRHSAGEFCWNKSLTAGTAAPHLRWSSLCFANFFTQPPCFKTFVFCPFIAGEFSAINQIFFSFFSFQLQLKSPWSQSVGTLSWQIMAAKTNWMWIVQIIFRNILLNSD